MRYAGDVLSGALNEVKKNLRAGITTYDVDQIAEKYILNHNCTPCFKGVYDYKYASNTSINEEIIHGMPNQHRVLADGDIISVDCGAGYNGICTDACRTFAVGEISQKAHEVINVTKECFTRATAKIRIGEVVGVVGETIEKYIKSLSGYSILENYFGHGIGKKLHEDPLIANYVSHYPQICRMAKTKICENTAICIEPMIIQSSNNKVTVGKDGWTVAAADGSLSAHYENTILITKKGAEILTDKYC
jgi:methionyl aminopeptidase